MILADYPGHAIALAMAVAAAFAVILAYRSHIARAAGPWRFLLGTMQYACILALLLIIWNPSGPTGTRRETPTSVIAVFDTSESMSVTDGLESSRLEQALALFGEEFRPGSPESPRYLLHSFDSTCRIAPPAEAVGRWGPRTNLHAVLKLIDRYRYTADLTEGPAADASRIAGAVVFTDGQADEKDVSSYFPAAGGDLPVLFVGIGNEDVPRDIAVNALRAPASVALATPYSLEVDLASRGIGAGAARVSIYEDGQVVGASRVEITGDSERITVPFTLAATALGMREIRAEASLEGEEPNTANNRRHTVIEIISAPTQKVLFYSEAANFDFGKVRSALERDDKIDLDIGLEAVISPDLAGPARSAAGSMPLPKKKEGFYEYDVIILGPCDTSALTAEQKEGLYSFVSERGGGLILLPGRDERDLSRISDAALAALLPVEISLPRPRGAGEPAAVKITPEGRRAGGFEPAEGKTEGALADAFHKAVLKKPAGWVLAEVGGQPIIAVHRVGRGNVALVNMYGLFRWYREDLGGGFLQKVLSALTTWVGKTTGAESHIDVFANRSAEDCLAVAFEAHVWDNSWLPLEGGAVLLEISGATVRMEEVGPGTYAAEVANLADESLFARVQVEKNGIFVGERMLAAAMPLPMTEMDNTARDGRFLAALAERVGAKYIPAEEVDSDTFRAFPPVTVTHEGGFASNWHRWPALIALCLLLSALWFIRRAIGLI